MCGDKRADGLIVVFIGLPVSFLSCVCGPQDLLKDRSEPTTLMMDVKSVFPISIPFVPSLVAMDAIQIPASLHLGFLTRV